MIGASSNTDPSVNADLILAAICTGFAYAGTAFVVSCLIFIDREMKEGLSSIWCKKKVG